MDYDYREAMKEDIVNAIREKCEWEGETIPQMFKDKEDAFDHLYDEFFLDDSVTGNASGSYYCNTYKAEEALCHNWDLLEEAINEFGCEKTSVVQEGAERCDVTIRCYLLAEMLTEVLEKIYEEE